MAYELNILSSLDDYLSQKYYMYVLVVSLLWHALKNKTK